jgi:glycosyltransferase involved in cell wall biosynthesis
MIQHRKIVVVMPAFNAEKTLRATFTEIPRPLVDEVILVDDASRDQTARLARRLGIRTIVHERNIGYGGNQKTCYRAALKSRADIVVMLHPDYQYTPKLIPSMAHLLSAGLYDVVLGSRILGGEALAGGMPLYKYLSNRCLTFAQNLLMNAKLSEYHTGYRAFTRRVLTSLPLDRNSDDFIFDGQMLSQALYAGFRVAEVTCPAKYFPEASSIGFRRSFVYGLGCLSTAVEFRLSKWGLLRSGVFSRVRPRERVR